MQRQFFNGNSIEQAVMSAARHYGVEPERVAYVVRDKKHGFLNIRRRVVIEVDPSKPELSDDEIAARATAGRGDRSGDSAPRSVTPKVVDVPAEVTPEEREDLAGPAEDDSDELDASGDWDDEDENDDDDFDAESDDAESDDADSDDADSDDDREHEARDGRDSGGRDSGGRDGGGRDGRDRGGRGGRERGGRDRGGRESRRDDRQRSGRGRSEDRDDSRGPKPIEHRGVSVDWEEEVEVEGESREMAAFEFAIEQVLDVMDLEIEYAITEGETFKIEFTGEDADFLTDDDGRVLKALEHVLPRIVRGLIGETMNCKVDCDGFRASHEDDLVEMAQEAADEVRESGDAKVLPQMNPSDRRIIHLALVDDPDVETISEGRGYMKRVRVQLLEED